MIRTLILALALSPAAAARAGDTEVVLDPTRDTTVYESGGGFISNGSGSYLFTGSTAQMQLRRALLRFEPEAAIPSGAEVVSAVLEIRVSKVANSAVRQVGLHRAESDWGEAGSDPLGEEGSGAPAEPGDATWLHTSFPNEFWNQVGGDFAPTPSATTGIGPTGFYSFSSATLTADVQSWLDNPAGNLGWFVVGNESLVSTSKRFDSRDAISPAVPPRLTVTFRAPTCSPQIASQETARVGSPPNPLAFLSGVTTGPVLGATWDPVVDHSSFVSDATLDFAVITGGPFNASLGAPGTLLCDVAAPPYIFLTAPAPGAPFQIPIPDNCGFSGVELCIQAGSLDSNADPHVANAIDITLGTL